MFNDKIREIEGSQAVLSLESDHQHHKQQTLKQLNAILDESLA